MKTLMQDTNGKFLLKIFLLFGVLTIGLLNKNLDLDTLFKSQKPNSSVNNIFVLAE